MTDQKKEEVKKISLEQKVDMIVNLLRLNGFTIPKGLK